MFSVQPVSLSRGLETPTDAPTSATTGPDAPSSLHLREGEKTVTGEQQSCTRFPLLFKQSLAIQVHRPCARDILRSTRARARRHCTVHVLAAGNRSWSTFTRGVNAMETETVKIMQNRQHEPNAVMTDWMSSKHEPARLGEKKEEGWV